MRSKKGQFLLLFFITIILAAIYLIKDSDYVSSPVEPTLTINNFPTPQYPAPDFTLLSLQNSEVTLTQHRGSVILLTFWTTW